MSLDETLRSGRPEELKEERGATRLIGGIAAIGAIEFAVLGELIPAAIFGGVATIAAFRSKNLSEQISDHGY